VVLLAAHDMIEHVVVNPLTGSVLVFHPHTTSVHEVERIVTNCLEQAQASVQAQRPDSSVRPSAPDSRQSDPSTDPIGVNLSKGVAWATATKLVDRAMAHRRELWKFLAASTGKKLIEASPPVIIGIAVDVLLDPTSSLIARMGLTTRLAPQLAIIAVAGLGLWTVRSWLAYEERVSSSELIEVMQHDLRSEAYARLQTLDMAVFDSAKVGALSSIIDSDVQEIEGLLESGVKPFIALGAYGAVTAFSLALVSPRMLLIPAACIPALLLLTISAIRPARERFAEAHRLDTDLNSLLIDNIDGIATIRAF
jgi:ATP-binding cassette subfamily B protein